VALREPIHHHRPELTMISHENDLHCAKQQRQQTLRLSGLRTLIDENLHVGTVVIYASDGLLRCANAQRTIFVAKKHLWHTDDYCQ
jgi:hypothetical protein